MTTDPYPKLKAKKPVGGFIFFTIQQLCLVWWAYRTRLIQLMDFRVWFAVQEMQARRCQMKTSQAPEYTPHELHGLVGGGGGEYLRASLRRLEATGLLTWSSTQLTFATSPQDLRGIRDLANFHTMYEAIPNRIRRVPVPRQAVRLIAGGLKATVIATMLGHLLRCLYYREHRCVSGGWCKASWIAEVFSIDLRSVKAARKHLVDIGWLQIFHTPQTLCNRWGTYAQISLSWTRAAMETLSDNTPPPPSELPSPPAFSTSELPPPNVEYKKPFQDLKHQKPASQADPARPPAPLQHIEPAYGGPSSGVQEQEKTKKVTTQAPTLRHIVAEDLQDTSRLLSLLVQAQTQGLIGKSESERLTFLGLAEHAKVVGSRNPCGLFAELLRRKCWHFVTEGDEDAAYKRLNQHLYGQSAQRKPSPSKAIREPRALSKDAFIICELQRECERRGIRGEVLPWLQQEDASWTRERWDSAVLELEQAKYAWTLLLDSGVVAWEDGIY